MRPIGTKRKLKGEPSSNVSIYGTDRTIKETNEMPGRPTKLTEQTEETIINMIRIGASFESACAAAGISSATFRDWCNTANKYPASICGAFLANVQKAIAESEIRDLVRVEQFTEGRPAEYLYENGKLERDKFGYPIKLRSEMFPDFRAVSWRLERRHNSKWGPKAQLNIDDGKDKPIDVTPQTTKELSTKLKDLTKALDAIDDADE